MTFNITLRPPCEDKAPNQECEHHNEAEDDRSGADGASLAVARIERPEPGRLCVAHKDPPILSYRLHSTTLLARLVPVVGKAERLKVPFVLKHGLIAV